MTEHFNKLTPAEAERLAWLMEECAEAQQAIGKILRHGYNSKNPFDPNHEGNRADLLREIRDINAAVNLMIEKGDLSQLARERNHTKLAFMHHQ